MCKAFIRVQSVVFALCAVQGLEASTIDLTPIPETYQVEGVTRKIVGFRTEDKPVLYSPPWKLNGAADEATFTIDEPRSSARIRRIPLKAPLNLEDEEAIKEWVVKSLPQGSDNISVETIEKNPVEIDGKPTIEVILTYGLYGLFQRQSVLLCQHTVKEETDLIVFELSCPPARFDALHRLLQKSLYSIMGF